MIYEQQDQPLSKNIMLISAKKYSPTLDYEEWKGFLNHNAEILMEIWCEDDVLFLVRIRK